MGGDVRAGADVFGPRTLALQVGALDRSAPESSSSTGSRSCVAGTARSRSGSGGTGTYPRTGRTPPGRGPRRRPGHQSAGTRAGCLRAPTARTPRRAGCGDPALDPRPIPFPSDHAPCPSDTRVRRSVAARWQRPDAVLRCDVTPSVPDAAEMLDGQVPTSFPQASSESSPADSPLSLEAPRLRDNLLTCTPRKLPGFSPFTATRFGRRAPLYW